MIYWKENLSARGGNGLSKRPVFGTPRCSIADANHSNGGNRVFIREKAAMNTPRGSEKRPGGAGPRYRETQAERWGVFQPKTQGERR